MLYRVKALTSGGALTVLRLEADSQAQAGHMAHDRGLDVISIRPDFFPVRWLGPRGGRFALLLFAQQLVALLDAGLGTVESLEAMARETSRSGSQTLHAVLAHVRAGRSLSFAMEQDPAAFPPLFVATIRASERTGDLQVALSRFVSYQQQVDRLRSKVVNASIYPLLLLGAGALVASFLLFYVVPRFGQIYADIGGQLPFMSRLLMQWGQLLSAHAGVVLPGLAVLTGAGAFAVTRPATRQWLWKRLWTLPRLGELLRIYQLARFYRTLGMLLRSGMPVLTALDMAAGLLDPALRPALREARREVSEGRPASTALSLHGLTTATSMSMLGVAERTGDLGPMMDRVASLYDDELARWVEIGTRLVEPILMALIGCVIGMIVVLLYMPVFELASSLK